jgi:hypothetical protein
MIYAPFELRWYMLMLDDNEIWRSTILLVNLWIYYKIWLEWWLWVHYKNDNIYILLLDFPLSHTTTKDKNSWSLITQILSKIKISCPALLWWWNGSHFRGLTPLSLNLEALVLVLPLFTANRGARSMSLQENISLCTSPIKP